MLETSAATAGLVGVIVILARIIESHTQKKSCAALSGEISLKIDNIEKSEKQIGELIFSQDRLNRNVEAMVDRLDKMLGKIQ